jgi:L-amino acid N-acyltransferase YncA
MGYKMNHCNSTTSSTPNRRSESRSQDPGDVLAQPAMNLKTEKSQMTNQNARATAFRHFSETLLTSHSLQDSRSLDSTPPTLLFGGKFNPDAYGKPSRLREKTQEHTSRQASGPSPTHLREVSIACPVPTSLDGPTKSPAPPGSNITQPSPAPCPPIVHEDTSESDLPTSTMAQDKSRSNKNGGPKKMKRKKGKRQMEENVKPSNSQLTAIAPVKPQETQEQKLERLQKQEITKLGHKIRQQGSEPTTSSRTLMLARQGIKTLQTSEMVPDTSTATMVALPPTTVATANEGTTESALLSGIPVQTKAQGPCLETTISSQTIKGCTDMVKVTRAAPNNLTVLAKAQGPHRELSERSIKSPTIGSRGGRRGRFKNGKNGRWATSAETKPPPTLAKSIDSNAFGSAVASDAETASGDSVAAMENGRLLRGNRPLGPDAPLGDWSGSWMPPPIDWDTRPRFNNNSEEFVGEFGRWKETAAAQSLDYTTGVPFMRLPRDLVENPDLHPDGLNLVDPTMSVDVDTADRYGYSGDALMAIKQDARLIDPNIFVLDWGKLDLRDAENKRIKDECCNEILRSHNMRLAKEREEEMSLKQAQRLARKRDGPVIPTPNPHVPRINIYLRPAVRSDMPQLRDIYNSYVKTSVRPAELHPITHTDMLNRWTDSTDEKLPFIVAVSKSAKINRALGNAVEKVVGWASATDWVSRRAVERFTVELEIYVHQAHLHQGVGKCLMDKLIDSTDRGHIARKGYPFTCAPEMRHGYSAGGARDLIKLLILVRSFDKPRGEKENDLPWIKKWLEDEWGFEQLGHYPRTGAKFKR